MSCVRWVERPRELRPGPPDHPEDEQRLGCAGPRKILDDVLGHLRDGEHEDQVEEEFYECHGLIARVVKSS